MKASFLGMQKRESRGELKKNCLFFLIRAVLLVIEYVQALIV